MRGRWFIGGILPAFLLAFPALARAYNTPFLDEPISVTDFTQEGDPIYAYHLDLIHSVRAISDSSQVVQNAYDYMAHGEAYGTPTEAIAQPYRFTSRNFDPERGDHYFRHRIYSPALAAFLSRDPLGLIDGPSPYREYFTPNGMDPYGLFDMARMRVLFEIKYADTYAPEFLAKLEGEGWQVTQNDLFWGWWDVDRLPDIGCAPDVIQLEEDQTEDCAAKGLYEALTTSGIIGTERDYYLKGKAMESGDLDQQRQALDKQDALNKIAAGAKMVNNVLELGLAGLSVVNEGIDWIIVIDDVAGGNYESAIALVPFISAGMVKGAKILIKQGDKVADVTPAAKRAAKGVDNTEDAAKGKPRFVGDDKGNIVDIQKTPPGSYDQPGGARTDVLQREDHGAGYSHTHDKIENTDPKSGRTYVNDEKKPGRPVTPDEVENIATGQAKPSDPKGR